MVATTTPAKTRKSSVESFNVIFDGSDHENHEIQIFTFARALTALGEVLYEANEEVNGSRDSIEVKVNAKFIEGSFGFEVDVVQLVENAKNIVEIIGFAKGASAGAGIGGLLGVLSWLRGEQIVNTKDEGASVSVETSDGRSRKFSKRLIQLATNKKIRSGLEGLIRAPLQSKGTSEVKFQSKKDPDAETVLSQDDAVAFVPIKRNELRDEDYTAVEAKVKFTATNIKRRTGWRVEKNDEEYSAKMMDDLFIERLKNSEDSTNLYGRQFVVTFGTRVVTQAGSKTVSYEIERVHHEL